MLIADLHIHSKYSRATSKELEPEQRKFAGAYTRERILEMLQRERNNNDQEERE